MNTKVFWNKAMTEEVRQNDATLNSIDNTAIYAEVDGKAVRVRRVISFEPVPEGESNKTRIAPLSNEDTRDLINSLADVLSAYGGLYPALSHAVDEWMGTH
jgi:hypothetical protein